MHCSWGTHEGDSVRVHNFTCTCTTLTQCHRRPTLISLQLSLLVSTSLIFLCRSVALENELLIHKSSTRFFAKYTHFAIVFAGSAERGTLLLWNGGWSIRLAAPGEELRLPKVEEKCTVPEVLTKAIRYTCTTSLAILHIYTHHPHSVSRCANHPTTFPFSLNFIDLFYVAQQHSRMSF